MNVICAMIFGSRYDIDDEEFLSIINSNVTFVRAFEYDNLVDIFPLLRLLPNKRLKMIKQALAIREPVLTKQLQDHRANFDGETVNDLTDALIKAAQDAIENDKEVCTVSFYIPVIQNKVYPVDGLWNNSMLVIFTTKMLIYQSKTN